MVKTKIVAKGKKPTGLAALKQPNSKDSKFQKRPPMADVHTEVKPFKKGTYKTSKQPYGGMGEDESVPVDKKKIKTAWEVMLDGQTYRTTDEEKVHIAISRSIKENKGINVQGLPENTGYAWYMTRIVTESEQEMIPGKRLKGK